MTDDKLTYINYNTPDDAGGDAQSNIAYDATKRPMRITQMEDASGNEVVKYAYDAWGNLLYTTGTLAGTLGYYNPFRYRGYIYDEETGLYYLRSRYYNPEWGRFLNADALIGKQGALLSHNVLAYCKNSVVSAIDSEGLDAVLITDTNGFSHSSLLIQNSKGDWYYFYWGSQNIDSSVDLSGSANGSTGSIGNSTNLAVKFGEITVTFSDDKEVNLDTLFEDAKTSDSIYYGGIFEKQKYFEGDYSKSFESAKNLYENQSRHRYDLLGSNCVQVCLRILSESTNNIWEKIKYSLLEPIVVPNFIHDLL